MNLSGSWLSRRVWLPACVVAIVLFGPVAQPAAAHAAIRLEFPGVQFGVNAVAAAAPGILGRVHRMTTRSERTFRRLAAAVSAAVLTWFWIFLSAAVFLVVSAIASATDLRMLDLRRQTAHALALDFGHGVRMFFRILRDGRTPYLPRAVLVLALLYWLLPVDLVGDARPVVGMLDDLVIAVVAAKMFIHLCPDAVVAAHAEALQTSA
jgi:uncharacterized membrane protein YkvA (DUF1232 family)